MNSSLPGMPNVELAEAAHALLSAMRALRSENLQFLVFVLDPADRDVALVTSFEHDDVEGQAVLPASALPAYGEALEGAATLINDELKGIEALRALHCACDKCAERRSVTPKH